MNFNIRVSSLILTVTVIGLLSVTLISGFVPQEPNVVAFTMSDANAEGSINVGELVNFTIILKNPTNTSITNITIFQPIKSFETDTIQLINSPLGAYSEPVNHTNDNGLMIENKLDNSLFQSNYLNITNSNFTLNFPVLESGFSLGIGFTLNFTNKRSSFTLSDAIIDYYDYWGDKNSIRSTINPTFNVISPEENSVAPYFPKVTVVDDIDYTTILISMFSIIIIVVLSRLLYGKNPLKL